MEKSSSIAHYMPVTEQDEKWGIVCTTVGFQFVIPNSPYPVNTHPDSYNFSKTRGRTLSEYQLVYIMAGTGTFESAHCKPTKVRAGTILFLFPGEWHSYAPDTHTGWREFWVGFRGPNIDRRVAEGFYSPTEPLIFVGESIEIENCYHEIIQASEKERSGFQILISSIVLHLLGLVVFKKNQQIFDGNPIVEKIDQARAIMRSHIGQNLSPQKIAADLNVGYTWFRRTFKEYVGTSPAQYQLQLKYIRAKELLATSALQITEIAYELGFDSNSQFSTFFKRHEGISARDYRYKSQNKK